MSLVSSFCGFLYDFYFEKLHKKQQLDALMLDHAEQIGRQISKSVMVSPSLLRAFKIVSTICLVLGIISTVIDYLATILIEFDLHTLIFKPVFSAIDNKLQEDQQKLKVDQINKMSHRKLKAIVFGSAVVKGCYKIVHRTLKLADMILPVMNVLIVIVAVVLVSILNSKISAEDCRLSAIYAVKDSLDNLIILIFVFQLLLLVMLFFHIKSKVADQWMLMASLFVSILIYVFSNIGQQPGNRSAQLVLDTQGGYYGPPQTIQFIDVLVSELNAQSKDSIFVQTWIGFTADDIPICATDLTLHYTEDNSLWFKTIAEVPSSALVGVNIGSVYAAAHSVDCDASASISSLSTFAQHLKASGFTKLSLNLFQTASPAVLDARLQKIKVILDPLGLETVLIRISGEKRPETTLPEPYIVLYQRPTDTDLYQSSARKYVTWSKESTRALVLGVENQEIYDFVVLNQPELVEAPLLLDTEVAKGVSWFFNVRNWPFWMAFVGFLLAFFAELLQNLLPYKTVEFGYGDLLHTVEKALKEKKTVEQRLTKHVDKMKTRQDKKEGIVPPKTGSGNVVKAANSAPKKTPQPSTPVIQQSPAMMKKTTVPPKPAKK